MAGQALVIALATVLFGTVHFGSLDPPVEFGMIAPPVGAIQVSRPIPGTPL